ncbi:GMC family oxidoreductase [Rhizobium sp. TRM95111]|uniref:GMC oxidoreductase n=1 Tax=Rhizobium alarense TaxID=2846851 RepID=UPI001F2B63A0|nr:GMC family oxidoreductase [Rhizobium alarense]MCF3641810.1 GMC family oxidoreductase [Rhizobium alarense]
MTAIVGSVMPAEKLFDICVIGAGPSGLTLASQLAASKLSVCVLESGGNGGSPSTYDHRPAETTGLPYAALSTSRLRGVGGSTQRFGWGGLCKPLDPPDFEERPWVENSGWPFDLNHLRPYYERASATLGVGDLDVLAGRSALFSGQSDLLFCDAVELCKHYRTGAHLKNELLRSQSVTLAINVTMLHLEYDENRITVASALCADEGGNQFRLRAKVYVLAAGGIENARLLLISNRIANRGEGLVGRYFMDHPRFTIGTVTPATRQFRNVLAGFDRIRVARWQRLTRKLCMNKQKSYRVSGLVLPFEAQARERLLNHRAWIVPCYYGQDQNTLERLRQSLLHFRDQSLLGHQVAGGARWMREINWTKSMHILRPKQLITSFQLQHILEPEPLADSAVYLSTQTDRYNRPQAALTWRLSSSTIESLKKTVGLLQQGFARAGLGRLDVHPDEWAQLDRPMWTWHHMGTTRMHADEKKGVVDPNCRVHGIHNLFVAGSSVFPTAGNDTPTFTIVALAHRLADYLLKFVS